MRTLYVAVALMSVIVLSCEKGKGVKDDCEQPCQPQRACTEEFRSILVEVLNPSGADIVLDSFVVVNKQNNQLVIDDKKVYNVLFGRVSYLLFSDSEMDKTTQCAVAFEFKGYKNQQLIADRDYEIAHNCCHIYLVSGDTKIIIDN
ncbi:hypothetical protein [Niabella aquatica]